MYCLLVVSVIFLNYLIPFSSHAASIIHIKIDGGINPAVQSLIERSLEEAKEINAEALLIEMDTPGGLLTSTRKIVQKILEAPLPVIVYVAPSGARAGSAGVFITLAAHVAAMAPSTNIGAAHPVSGGGKDIEGHMAEKVTNDTVAWVEGIAKARKRNQKFAIDSVKKSASIDSETALKRNVIDYVVASKEELLSKIHGTKVKVKGKTHVFNTKNAQLIEMEFELKEKFIDTLSNPNIAYILMMVGMVGLYIELSHPGAIFPGVIGAISLLLSFICLQALPINYGGLALLILGLLLLIAEIFVPSFGVLGIGGLVSLLLGSIFLIDPAGSDLTISLALIIPTVLSTGGIMLFVGFFVMKAFRKKDVVGAAALIGKGGEVVADISPAKEGKVFVYGDYWNAKSSEDLKVGDEIVVEKVEGMVLTVKRKN